MAEKQGGPRKINLKKSIAEGFSIPKISVSANLKTKKLKHFFHQVPSCDGAHRKSHAPRGSFSELTSQKHVISGARKSEPHRTTIQQSLQRCLNARLEGCAFPKCEFQCLSAMFKRKKLKSTREGKTCRKQLLNTFCADSSQLLYI